MKKLILILLCMIFLIGIVSAIDFDDVKYYNESAITYSLENFFGLGKHIAELELKTPQNNLVARGYKKIAEIEIRNGEYDYDEIINGIELQNIKEDMKEVVRNVDYKYKTIIQVPKYKTVCDKGLSTNGTIVDMNCRKEQVGLEDEIVWKDFTNNSLLKGEIITLGIFTDVKKGDHMEWILNVYGNERLIAWAEWTESIEANIISYYKLDETSGSAADHFENNTGTVIGALQGVPGKINNSYSFNAGGDRVAMASFVRPGHITISAWVNANASANDKAIVGARDLSSGGGENSFLLRVNGLTGTVQFIMELGGSKYVNGSTDITGSFHHVVVTYNGSEIILYVDNVSVDTNSDPSGNMDGGTGIAIGMESDSQLTSDFEGKLDEIGIWSEAKSVSDINDIWNNGDGITPPVSPIVNIIFPLNITYNTTQTQLNYTVSANGVRCWFSIDGGVTNSSDNDCTENFVTASVAGGNTWTVYSNNSAGQVGQDSVTFTVESGIVINLINPVDNFKTVNPTVNFRCNATDNFQLVNLTLVLDGAENITNTTVGTSMILNQSLLLVEGNHNWTCKATDNESFILTETPNRTFQIHTTPANITILFPNETISSFTLGNNLTLNWSITESGQNLTAHILGCAYTYNGVAVNLNTTACVSINETSFLYVRGVNNISMNVTDEFNITTSTTSTWEIRVLEISQTFNNETIEGSTEQFVLNTSIISGTQVSIANLVYNGTSNLATNAIQGDFTISTANIIIPSIVAEVNITFNWNITLTNSTQVSLPSNNQTIKNLSIDNCTTGTTVIFNYTMVDEGNQSQLDNTTLEVDLRLLSLDRTTSVANFSREYNSINPAAICININLTSGTRYSTDSIVRYEAIAYANEYYNIQNFTMQNTTIPQEITLFDLFGADSTEFQITFKDSNFVPVENALVQISRQYISEGVFKTVEIPKTDSNGQTVAHLVEKEVIYNILITKNGEVLGTFNNVVAFCEDALIGSCFISLNALETNPQIFDYDIEIGLISSFEYNQTTRNLQFDFTTTDGSVKNITLIGLKLDQLGNTTVCTTSLVSATGSLFCTVPDSIGNETIIVDIFVDGDLRITNYIKAGRDFDIGDVGYFLMFFLVLSLALMMVESKTAVVVGVVIGFIASALLSFVRGGLLGIGSSFVWLVIMAIIVIWKLNSQRQT